VKAFNNHKGFHLFVCDKFLLYINDRDRIKDGTLTDEKVQDENTKKAKHKALTTFYKKT